MEYAVWKGKRIIASEVSRDYQYEKAVRLVSNKELRCPDPECKSPILKYCHGEKKAPYFSHVTGGKCDYATYDHETPSILRDIKLKVYNRLKSTGSNVEMDVKLLEHHYASLSVALPDGKTLAIELCTKATTAVNLDEVSKEYQQKGILVQWIIVSDELSVGYEENLFFSKRFSLNESQHRDSMVVLENSDELLQLYHDDPSQYCFDGRIVPTTNYQDFSLRGRIEDLRIEENALTIHAFYEKLNAWKEKKNKAFESKKKQLQEEKEEREKRANEEKEEERRREERLKSVIEQDEKTQNEAPSSNAPDKSSTTTESRPVFFTSLQRTKPPVKQPQVNNIHYTALCVKCNKWKSMDEFPPLVRLISPTSGICKECYEKK